MRHTSIYQEEARKRKPSKNIGEALVGFRDAYKALKIRTRYPAKGSERTRQLTNRMIGERE